jgi:hypothetical protein
MLTDERYKQLMESVGMPNSRSMLQALQQCAMEAALAEREECAKLCDNNACDYTREGAEVCAAEIRAR